MKRETTNSQKGRTTSLRIFNQLYPTPDSFLANSVTQLLAYSKEPSGTQQAILKERFISHLLTTLPKSFFYIINIITHGPEAQQTTNCTTSPAAALIMYNSSRFCARNNFTLGYTISRSLPHSCLSFGRYHIDIIEVILHAPLGVFKVKNMENS